MKKVNIYLIPAILFFLLAIVLIIAIFQSAIISLVTPSIVAGLCALKFWILYFMERRKQSKGEEK